MPFSVPDISLSTSMLKSISIVVNRKGINADCLVQETAVNEMPIELNAITRYFACVYNISDTNIAEEVACCIVYLCQVRESPGSGRDDTCYDKKRINIWQSPFALFK